MVVKAVSVIKLVNGSSGIVVVMMVVIISDNVSDSTSGVGTGRKAEGVANDLYSIRSKF